MKRQTNKITVYAHLNKKRILELGMQFLDFYASNSDYRLTATLREKMIICDEISPNDVIEQCKQANSCKYTIYPIEHFDKEIRVLQFTNLYMVGKELKKYSFKYKLIHTSMC